MNVTINDQPLPYVSALPERNPNTVELVVIHCTELPDMTMTREYGEKAVHASGTGNSGHYYIDRDGSITCFVPGNRIANHVRGHNPYSIGIELVNLGRYPDWWDSHRQQMSEPYPPAQINALHELLDHLRSEFPNLRKIAGHEDLDTEMIPASDDPSLQVRRKLDPGAMFPWGDVLRDSKLTRIGERNSQDQR
ncbi:MAG: N-acetylmuramoyl-L-alanine amidase [Rhodanobacter sp.]